MLILTMRTDKPEAEVGLYQDGQKLAYKTWTAHRQLAETLHQVIVDVLAENGKALQNVEAIGVYQGPGSFTGLRIGLTVANAMADGFGLPIAGAQGEGWLPDVLARLQAGENDVAVMPEYGAEVHITLPKH
jgi:tRNA threonylcarbamoyladenosine biosynthesis protein TsaB